MTTPEQVPSDLRRAMFRTAALAFLLAMAASLASDFVGPVPKMNYPTVLAISGLACAGAAVCWFLPWHRAPGQRFLGVILPGIVLVTVNVLATGGVRSHLLVLYVAPAVFTAALLELRWAAVVALLTLVAAATPLLAGWDGFYARSLIVLAAVAATCAYIPARVRRALNQEYALAEKRRHELEETYVATIGALAVALDAKDRYTEAHSRETAALAVAVGRRLGLKDEALQFLEYGALLHDVGKIGIPGYVLHKPGPLDPDEQDIMREHPVIGERIVASVPFLTPVRMVVRAEHERWDGTGYPDGLAGEEIPLEARIIQACDAFHAMATDRPYRRALQRSHVLTELRVQSGKQFDPRVVDALISVIETEEVKLEAGAAGTTHVPAPPVIGPRAWERHLDAVEEISVRLRRATGVPEVCRLIGEALVPVIPHDACRILLAADHDKRLVPAYVSRPKKTVESSLASQEVDGGEGITAWIAETRRGIVLGDVARHPKARQATGYPDREDSIVAAPLIFEEKLLGVITVLKQGLNRYGSDHLRLLKILANQAAVAIAGARLGESLAAAHMTDLLTGLPNRGEFEKRLADRLSIQPPEPFALMTVDVDQLKLRNHASGFPAGDSVLKQVADVLRTNLRPEDLAARWDGDEFLVLMPGLDEFAARALVKRMWMALLMPDDPAAAIPVAFGTAAYPSHGTSAESLLGALERSRQLAKQLRAA